MPEKVKIKTDEGDLIGVLCCESNRGQSEAVLTPPLVVLAHGLAGYKEEGMLQCVADYFRQCGLYSHIKLVPSADTSSNTFTLEDIELNADTGEPDAVLEVIENRVAALRQTASNEVFAWILEF